MAELGEANIGGRMVPAWILNGNANGLDISESSEHPGCFYRKLSDGTVEWVNPPMQLGVEYRTTERYLGKPVYAMAVDFGAMPNATTKSVTWQGSGVVSSVLSVEASDSNGGALGLGASLSGTEITATKTLLYVKSAGDYSSTSAVFRIKYTKTAD